MTYEFLHQLALRNIAITFVPNDPGIKVHMSRTVYSQTWTCTRVLDYQGMKLGSDTEKYFKAELDHMLNEFENRMS